MESVPVRLLIIALVFEVNASREGSVVVVHVVGEFTQADGSLVLYASVVLAQRTLNGVVGVLSQIQF